MPYLVSRRHFAMGMVATVLLGAALHPFFMTIIARQLSAGDSQTAASHLLFLRSARVATPAFEFTEQFARRNATRKVLVFRDYVRRAEAIGAAPPFVETTISQLVEAGIPRAQIDVIGDPNLITAREKFRYIADWLSQQSADSELLIVTHLFRTNYIATVANWEVPTEARGRIHVLGFPRHGITEANWWKSSVGLKNFFSEALRRFHLAVFGVRRPDVSWDPDIYEQTLRESKP